MNKSNCSSFFILYFLNKKEKPLQVAFEIH
nr:MAG TPA: hypothetical protein [Caudoviricetes sp.]